VTWNSNYELNWGPDGYDSAVVTQWLPDWWTKMVLNQSTGKISGSGVATETSIDGVIPSEIDMGWTTVKETEPSKWIGADLWEGWNTDSKDFHSALIVGEKEMNPTRAAIIAKVRAAALAKLQAQQSEKMQGTMGVMSHNNPNDSF